MGRSVLLSLWRRFSTTRVYNLCHAPRIFTVSSPTYSTSITADNREFTTPKSESRRYITDKLKKKEDCQLKGKLPVTVSCSGCGDCGRSQETLRLIHQEAQDQGTVLVRCRACDKLHLLADHLHLLPTGLGHWGSNINIENTLRSAQVNTQYKLLRFDQDTIEIVAAVSEDDSSKDSSDKTSSDCLSEEHISECITSHFSGDVHVVDLCGRVDEDGAGEGGYKLVVGDGHVLEVLKYEYEMLMYSQGRIPNRVSEHSWLQLMDLSHGQRRKFYNFLFKREKTMESDEEKKLENRMAKTAERQELHKRANAGELVYGIGLNTIFRRLSKRHFNQLYQANAATGYMFGEPIIYDLGYEGDMNSREIRRCAQQLVQAYGWNVRCREAARILFTNLNPDGELCQEFENLHVFDSHTFIDCTSENPLDLFNRKKLVILSPDAKDYVPDEYDGESLYVISALVDLGASVPVVYANAKRFGVRSQKFPFDKYIQWGASSSKALPLDVCHKILHTWMVTGSWLEAFSHVPTRKLYHPHTEDTRERRLAMARRRAGYAPLASLD